MAKNKPRIDKKEKNLRCPYCKSLNINSKGITKNKTIQYARAYKCSDCGKYFRCSIGDIDKIRVLIISDTHCGHITGLTPKGWQQDGIYGEFQKESWMWFENMVERLKPIDVLLCNGDMIDGRQERSGGSELIVGDRFQQISMAQKIIERVGAKKVFMTRGTPYHVGKLEQWEDILADKVDANIKNKQVLNINGCIINARHKIGRSTIPQGRFTQMAKRAMWEDLMTVGKTETRANIIICSHVHYNIYGGHSNNRLFFTTPALQGSSDYGEKECEGSVDYGLCSIDIDKNGLFEYKSYIADFKTQINQIENIKISK